MANIQFVQYRYIFGNAILFDQSDTAYYHVYFTSKFTELSIR